jgi:hypothetical protein
MNGDPLKRSPKITNPSETQREHLHFPWTWISPSAGVIPLVAGADHPNPDSRLIHLNSTFPVNGLAPIPLQALDDARGFTTFRSAHRASIPFSPEVGASCSRLTIAEWVAELIPCTPVNTISRGINEENKKYMVSDTDRSSSYRYGSREVGRRHISVGYIVG